MAVSGKLSAFVLTTSQCLQLASCEQFWSVLLDQARHVDSLPDYDGCTKDVLRYLFGTDYSIPLPNGRGTDFGSPIDVVSDATVLTCMTRHDAQVLRSRIEKRGYDAEAGISQFESCYIGAAEQFENKSDVYRQCINFMKRQVTHFRSDDERLLLVVDEDFQS